jgi:hypothetical protein
VFVRQSRERHHISAWILSFEIYLFGPFEEKRRKVEKDIVCTLVERAENRTHNQVETLFWQTEIEPDSFSGNGNIGGGGAGLRAGRSRHHGASRFRFWCKAGTFGRRT